MRYQAHAWKLITLFSLLFSCSLWADNNPKGYTVNSVAELKQRVTAAGLLTALPKDFPQIRDAKEKKRLFIQLMTPIINAENRRIEEQRRLVQLILPKQARALTDGEADKWLKQLFKLYRVKLKNGYTPDKGEQLLQRINRIPAKLIMAQAAIESGWGTSRFALLGNSLFGQWTWTKGAGITPESRDEGATHSVQAFPSLQASVRSYMVNLNRNRAYQGLRDLRQQKMDAGQHADAHTLAAGLSKYSQRGQHYVDELRSIINSKDFRQLDNLTLRLAQQ
jgi:Bax protein